MTKPSNSYSGIASVGAAGALALMLTIAGCSMFGASTGNPAAEPASTGAVSTANAPKTAAVTPPPDIRDCGIVTISTPSKYVCDGKVYTSRQITQMRADWTAAQSQAAK